MTEFYKKILPKISEYISKNQLQKLELFYNTLKTDYQKHIFNYCLDYTILKNHSLIRKIGTPNFVHPINVALQAISYNMDYISVCGALLHDVIEDQIEENIKEKSIFSKEDKGKKSVVLRTHFFTKFKYEMNKLLKKIGPKNIKANNDIYDIINLVDILTRYNTPYQHYYDYIKDSFSDENKSFSKNTIYTGIILKFIDRTDNILSMDTKLRTIIDNKLRIELKIIDLIESEKIKKKYRKILFEQNSLLVDYSFSGGNRLNQIWKNTYLLIRARMYFCNKPKFKDSTLTQLVEKDLIENTLKVLNNHKFNLKLYLSKEITSYWDELAKTYNEIGGLDGRTPNTIQENSKNQDYLIFNSTLDIFSQYLLKNNKEFKKLQIDKETQYKYLALIYEMLMKFKKNYNFVCDLSKEIKLKEKV